MSTHNKEAAEREAFEKWFESEYGPFPTNGEAPPNGDPFYYFDDDVDDAWKVWLARSALTASEAPAIEQAPTVKQSLTVEQAPAGEVPSDELAEEIALREKFALLLAGVAVGLKGEELPLHRHSYHDLPEVATVLRLERDLLKVQVEELQAALSTPPAVPPGWRLVPVEPDLKMVIAGENYIGRHAWVRMLSAAPAAPQTKENK